MSDLLIPVKIHCAYCRELYDDYMIDGTVAQPHICPRCWARVMKAIERRAVEEDK